MITPQQARETILKHANPGASQSIALKSATGFYLAEDIAAPHAHPLFDQSAMDGYAIRHEDAQQFERLQVIGEIPAGATSFPEIGPGHALRIYTGALMPSEADTVIIQEHVRRDGPWIYIEKLPETGKNIRRKGEQIEKGSVALHAGTLIDSAAVGYLASIGIQEVDVYQTPSAGIITTGDEFLAADDTPQPGKIFESNGQMLESLLHRTGYSSKRVICEDSLPKLTDTISQYAQQFPVLFITGGVSVGDYDYTLQALEAAGFDMVFHKINQKPGKPLLFAIRGACIAFGMPGNPRSVLSCFHHYALPALKKIAGAARPLSPTLRLPLTEPVENKSQKTLFLYATLTEEGVKPAKSQGSHMLQSAVNAHALLELEAEKTHFVTGDFVRVHLLPR